MAVTARGYLSLTRLKLAQGDQDSARQALWQASETTQDWESPRLVAEAAAERTRLWLLQGDLAAASGWRQESGLSTADMPNAATEAQLLILVRVLLAQARQTSPAGQALLAETGQLLKHLRQTATAAGHLGRVIEILILQGQVYALQGNPAAALTAIEQALLLAEPEGYMRVFIDEGQPVAALLGEAQAKGIVFGYTKRLLAAFPAPSLQPAKTSPQPAAGAIIAELPEPLSDREIEVLRLITAGLSNSEIAEELVLAVSTVKRHISNIYGKLNVNSRTQAIARARELKLL
jgi:LuxR family maltose regulon positive regulatory protein